jgi:hypothetical protein
MFPNDFLTSFIVLTFQVPSLVELVYTYLQIAVTMFDAVIHSASMRLASTYSVPYQLYLLDPGHHVYRTMFTLICG